jgi:hypothetical protein
MATAKEYAKQQLGDLDLGHHDKERQVAKESYTTSKGSLENNFNNLIEQIGLNKQSTQKGFNTGRSAVAENAFGQNRLNKLDVGSRIMGKSGLQELGEVGNRMETGRQYSGLANTYYDDMNKLNTTEKQSKSAHEFDQQGLTNWLNQQLTGIDSRGAEAKNAYNMSLGQLAESVQGRWDNNANAKAALAQAQRAAAQANANAQSAAKAQLTAAKTQQLNDVLRSGTSKADMSAQIQRLFGVSPAQAQKIVADAIQYPANVEVRSRMDQANTNIGLPNSRQAQPTQSGSLADLMRGF